MRFALLLSLLLAFALPAGAQVRLTNLRCEYMANPLGIDVAQPRLGWQLRSDRRGERQTAYQVLVATNADRLAPDRADLWDSGKVASDESAHVAYAGKLLASGQRALWTVRVWDRDGKPSGWSQPASWEMGMLKPGDWQGAQWIGAAQPTSASPYLRRAFTLAPQKRVATARLYITALGVYEPYLNGKRVSSDVFAPGWTDYRKRVQYQTYDVTRMLANGANALGVMLGDGWYAGHVGLAGRNVYGKQPLLLCRLVVGYADGSSQSIITDGSWKCATGPITASDMLMGEDYDARKDLGAWSAAAYDDAAWQPIQVAPPTVAQLDAQRGPAVRVTQEMAPKAITEPKPGAYVFDLGQNMVGVARLKVAGPAGTTVTLRFAEMLNPDGTLYTTNYRSARCTDHYTLRGGGTEVYEPHFTFRGFRYVEVTGFPGKPNKGAITGVVIGSDLPPAGTFACSNPMVNQLQSNIVWGQRGNFLSVPTDCPQRDERLGWMGDAQIFIRTASCNRDVAGFFTKWLVDVDDAQSADGAFTDVSPRVAAGEGTAAWGDAGIICPWTVYLAYGDRRIVEEHYPAMQRYVDYMERHSANLLRPAQGYGDWLSIAADTPRDVLATAYFAYSTRLLARMAEILGRHEDAARYEALFGRIRDAFNAAYVGPDGRIKGDTQTDYVLALRFDLLPASKRATAARYLTEDIARKGNHLSTGFVGVGYLLPTLTSMGYTDVAYRLLNQDTFPSWGYSIKYGATTIWERWDGWTKERGFQDPGMNSFNHYSLGSVGEWLYDTVAGLAPDASEPGYKHILLRPTPGGGLTHASATYASLYGPVANAWRLDGHAFSLDVTVPPNTTATLYLPGASATEGGMEAAKSRGVRFVRSQDGTQVFELGSGTYHFQSTVSGL